MSEYDGNRSDATSSDTLDDATGGADNSIIGKVKSRVSNILPNSLYKWFSPSSKVNDSLNGNLSSGSGIALSNARRRRRLEVEEDEEDDDDDQEDAEEEEDDDDQQHPGEYDENTLRNHKHNNNTDEESNNSDDASAVVPSISARRSLNTTTAMRQPPSKRSRFTLDITNTRGSPLVQRQPLLSSTPTMNSSNARSVIVPNRYTHLNLYEHQSKKETPYNFSANLAITREPMFDGSQQGDMLFTAINTRRHLNIPLSTHAGGQERCSGLADLKRQTLTSVKGSNMPSTSAGVIHEKSALPQRTSTTILEVEAEEVEDYEREQQRVENQPEAVKYNGRSSNYAPNKRQRLINGASSGGLGGEAMMTTANADNLEDSTASESSDGVGLGASNMSGMQRKTGLFNMSAANSRYGSRTSSFGNGLNFYSHLEGRKSLFAGMGGNNAMNNSTLSLTSLNRRQFNASIYGSTSALSDSRLLNTFSPFYKGRTTYGGAAAYNKYAAMNAGAGTGAGTGASAVRITPTLIRPTSSLSTLSSSSNSLATAGANASENSALSSTAKRILDLINDFATPLSEAKKMASNLKANQQQQLHLPQTKTRLNDLYLEAARATRLSQVRTPYMRPTVMLQPGAAHVNGQAAMTPTTMQLPPVRELQVPSMSQLLQMKKLQHTTERARQTARQHGAETTQTGARLSYTLPNTLEDSNADGKQQQQQQKHTNKIKHKLSTSTRISSAAKDSYEDVPPPPVNLPNIAFPLMQSVPKIDITLPPSTSALATASTRSPTGSLKTAASHMEAKFGAFATTTAAVTAATGSPPTFAFNTETKNTSKSSSPVSTGSSSTTRSVFTARSSPTTPTSTSTTTVKSASGTTNFKFSAPLVLEGLSKPTQHITPIKSNYKFSPPTLVQSAKSSSSDELAVMPISKSPAGTINKVEPSVAPQLKTGSVLDALKQPSMSVSAGTTSITTATTVSGFGSQFKKSTAEWECDACMVRNKLDASKCVACETPRKTASPSTAAVASSAASNALPLTSSFGNQFKKSSGEWECDACMVRNKSEASKCVACETPHKGATSSSASLSTSSNNALLPLQPIKNSFGDAFKPKANTWECSTCLVQNQNTAMECIACQTAKPGAAAAAPPVVPAATSTQFKFGFAAAKSVDSGFKALAAEQKASKWECEACMTRNDAARLKCVCCEQAKPGSQTVSENVPKFAFGTTAAAKFSFGFGAAAAAQATATTAATTGSTTTTSTATTLQTDSQAKPTGFVFGSGSSVAAATTKSTTAAPAPVGFTFGLKPAATAVSKDVADTAAVASKAAPAAAATGFVFGAATTNKTVQPASAATSAVSSTASPVSSPSVKFNLPSSAATTAATPTAKTTAISSISKQAAAPVAASFSFGSPAASTSSATAVGEVKPGAGGFAFGTTPKPAAPAAKAAGADAPALGGFAFKPPAIPAPAAADSNKSFNFTSPSAASSKAAVKPMFAFGASTASATPAASLSTAAITSLTSTPTSTAATAAAAASTAGGFSFGGNSSSVANAAPASKPLFGAGAPAVPPSTANAVASSNAPAAGNVFGSFGGAASAASASMFGAASKASSAGLATASVTTAVPTFGSFGGTTSATSTAPSTNIFGAFGSPGGPTAKPTATAAPIFSSGTAAAAPVNTFAFGSGAAAAPASSAATVATPATNNAAAASTWPQSTFAFGSSGSVAPTAGATASDASKPVFGGFVGNNATPTASIFGNLNASASASNPPPAFGSAGSNAPIFGSNSALGAGSSSTGNSIFGATSAGNATNPAPPAFGANSTFGSSNAATTSATPTFGSSTATPATFGGFGGSAATTAHAAPIADGASAAKKPELSFNFGGAAAAQSASGGFNFGAAAKPAFNFGATSQPPAFNFTGTTTEAQATKPFQFGATPTAPIYNFSSGAAPATEATPNAPFQFNAGATPASSNIFAPNPTPGAQAAQQARRKIRAPIRRLTPR